MELNDIIGPIDLALAENKRVMDALHLSEDTMWALMSESIEKGYRTQVEAEAEFMEWRDNMRTLGAIAIREA